MLIGRFLRGESASTPEFVCYGGGEGLGLSSPFRISLRRPSGQDYVVLFDGLSCATDRNEGSFMNPFSSLQAILQGGLVLGCYRLRLRSKSESDAAGREHS